MEKVHLHATTIKLNNKVLKPTTTTHILTCLLKYNTLQYWDLTKVSLRVVFSFNNTVKLLWGKNPTQTERTLSIRENYLQWGCPHVLLFDSNQSFLSLSHSFSYSKGEDELCNHTPGAGATPQRSPLIRLRHSVLCPGVAWGCSLVRLEDSGSKGVSAGNLRPL